MGEFREEIYLRSRVSLFAFFSLLQNIQFYDGACRVTIFCIQSNL